MHHHTLRDACAAFKLITTVATAVVAALKIRTQLIT